MYDTLNFVYTPAFFITLANLPNHALENRFNSYRAFFNLHTFSLSKSLPNPVGLPYKFLLLGLHAKTHFLRQTVVDLSYN